MITWIAVDREGNPCTGRSDLPAATLAQGLYEQGARWAELTDDSGQRVGAVGLSCSGFARIWWAR